MLPLLLVSLALASDAWTTPLPWVDLLTRSVSGSDPQRIWVARVDLCEDGVRPRATTWDERQQTTSDWAEGVGASIAINGAFFSYSDYSAVGWSIGDGEDWPTAYNASGYSAVAFATWARATIFADGTVFPVEGEDWWREQVPGWPLIVWDGAAVDIACTSHLCDDNPRTAIGLTSDGETAILAVVDGRSDAAQGMDMAELQELMLEMGAYSAMNLDGGGSTTLWLDGMGVLNEPSDGSERVVASHLGFIDDPTYDEGCCSHEPVADATGIFADVPDTAWFKGYAEALYAAGITSGCQSEPLLFCPDCVVDRATLAVFIVRAMGLEPVTGVSSFADVDPSSWYAPYIEALYAAGITSGCGDGLFCPDRLATRWEAAAFTFRGMGIPEVEATGLFSDVSADDAGWLEALAEACVIAGCDDGLFCPDDEVTRAQMAKILAVAFSVDPYAPCGDDTGETGVEPVDTGDTDVTDTGTPLIDTAPPVDTGDSDAPTDTGHPAAKTGCGCSTRGGSGWGWLVAALLLVRHRRRSRATVAP